MPVEDTIALQTALCNLAISCYKDRVEYVNKIMEFTLGYLTTQGVSK